MSDPKPHRSFAEVINILSRWRHLALARWILFSMSLCLTLTSDNTANQDFFHDSPVFTHGRRRLRSDASIMQQMEQRSLQHYSKSAKSLSAKAGKSVKGSKVGDHEWSERSDTSWVASKFGKSKAGKAKSAKSAFGSKSSKGIKATGKSAKSESHLRSAYESKSAKGIKGKGKSTKSLEGKSAKYIAEFIDTHESSDETSEVTFKGDRSPFDGDESRYSSEHSAAPEVKSAINASMEDSYFIGHGSVEETESGAGESASSNNEGAAVQPGVYSETFAAIVESPQPTEEFDSVHSGSNNEITYTNSSLRDYDIASSFLEQGSDLADTVASVVPNSYSVTIAATSKVDAGIVDTTNIDHDAEIMGDNDADLEAME
ncbi:hypothetical protein HJC23_009838 [Cyclotella cryptica]|uniref:Uncharacterized protein n=1 Tax=Cyclotella cryptica TaxID=29204 RepID=A0ABD3NST3_9STRA|eukprot:CCRYP_019927-RA/>CCRYP_019927-RA protein AED:0.42 eAED:0.42 QI:0/-1/0/1/-1/1/1/0/372